MYEQKYFISPVTAKYTEQPHNPKLCTSGLKLFEKECCTFGFIRLFFFHESINISKNNYLYTKTTALQNAAVIFF
jgi:hypothetical protein